MYSGFGAYGLSGDIGSDGIDNDNDGKIDDLDEKINGLDFKSIRKIQRSSFCIKHGINDSKDV